MGYKTYLNQQIKKAASTHSIFAKEAASDKKTFVSPPSQTGSSNTKEISTQTEQPIHYKILRKQLESLILEKFKMNQRQTENLIATTECIRDNTQSQKEQIETILQEIKKLSSQIEFHHQQFIKKEFADNFQTKILLVAIYMSIVSTAFIAKQLFHINGLWSWLKIFSGFKILIE